MDSVQLVVHDLIWSGGVVHAHPCGLVNQRQSCLGCCQSGRCIHRHKGLSRQVLNGRSFSSRRLNSQRTRLQRRRTEGVILMCSILTDELPLEIRIVIERTTRRCQFGRSGVRGQCWSSIRRVCSVIRRALSPNLFGHGGCRVSRWTEHSSTAHTVNPCVRRRFKSSLYNERICKHILLFRKRLNNEHLLVLTSIQ